MHIRPTIKAVVIENGDQHFVMTKTDTVYSFDGLVEAVTARLEQLTGESLQGQVTHAGNHNHSSYGTFSTPRLLPAQRQVQPGELREDGGPDRPGGIRGLRKPKGRRHRHGCSKDWDPNDRVYNDRRGENNDLVVWDDMGPEQGGKDPYLHLMRFDDAQSNDPIAIVMAWGMHPYVSGESESLATADATALAEAEVAESFDEQVVVMHLQTGGGDASVRGSDQGWARMETVGLYARDAVLALWENTPTSAAPFTLEATSRAIQMHGADVRVTRNGTVDWHYLPYDEERLPDEEVFDENGDILSPLDEWNTDFGAVFCGSGDFDLPVGWHAHRAPHLHRVHERQPHVAPAARVLPSRRRGDRPPAERHAHHLHRRGPHLAHAAAQGRRHHLHRRASPVRLLPWRAGQHVHGAVAPPNP